MNSVTIWTTLGVPYWWWMTMRLSKFTSIQEEPNSCHARKVLSTEDLVKVKVDSIRNQHEAQVEKEERVKPNQSKKKNMPSLQSLRVTDWLISSPKAQGWITSSLVVKPWTHLESFVKAVEVEYATSLSCQTTKISWWPRSICSRSGWCQQQLFETKTFPQGLTSLLAFDGSSIRRKLRTPRRFIGVMLRLVVWQRFAIPLLMGLKSMKMIILEWSMAKSLFQIQIWWNLGRNIRSYVGWRQWNCDHLCRWRRQWGVGKWIGPSPWKIRRCRSGNPQGDPACLPMLVWVQNRWTEGSLRNLFCTQKNEEIPYEIGVIWRILDGSGPSIEALFVKKGFCKKSHIHQIYFKLKSLKRKWFEQWSF